MKSNNPNNSSNDRYERSYGQRSNDDRRSNSTPRSYNNNNTRDPGRSDRDFNWRKKDESSPQERKEQNTTYQDFDALSTTTVRTKNTGFSRYGPSEGYSLNRSSHMEQREHDREMPQRLTDDAKEHGIKERAGRKWFFISDKAVVLSNSERPLSAVDITCWRNELNGFWLASIPENNTLNLPSKSASYFFSQRNQICMFIGASKDLSWLHVGYGRQNGTREKDEGDDSVDFVSTVFRPGQTPTFHSLKIDFLPRHIRESVERNMDTSRCLRQVLPSKEPEIQWKEIRVMEKSDEIDFHEAILKILNKCTFNSDFSGIWHQVEEEGKEQWEAHQTTDYFFAAMKIQSSEFPNDNNQNSTTNHEVLHVIWQVGVNPSDGWTELGFGRLVLSSQKRSADNNNEAPIETLILRRGSIFQRDLDKLTWKRRAIKTLYFTGDSKQLKRADPRTYVHKSQPLAELTNAVVSVENNVIQFTKELVSAENNFWRALQVGDLDAVKNFLEKDPSLLNSYCHTEELATHTPLIVAARFGHRHLVEFLLDQGADIELNRDGYKSTALHWAMVCGHKDIMRYLVEEKGASLDLAADYAKDSPELQQYIEDQLRARQLKQLTKNNK